MFAVIDDLLADTATSLSFLGSFHLLPPADSLGFRFLIKGDDVWSLWLYDVLVTIPCLVFSVLQQSVSLCLSCLYVCCSYQDKCCSILSRTFPSSSFWSCHQFACTTLVDFSSSPPCLHTLADGNVDLMRAVAASEAVAASFWAGKQDLHCCWRYLTSVEAHCLFADTLFALHLSFLYLTFSAFVVESTLLCEALHLPTISQSGGSIPLPTLLNCWAD